MNYLTDSSTLVEKSAVCAVTNNSWSLRCCSRLSGVISMSLEGANAAIVLRTRSVSLESVGLDSCAIMPSKSARIQKRYTTSVGVLLDKATIAFGGYGKACSWAR